ncbi:NAD(P)-dependent oxidoreductase [Paenarthrobacter aurescens]|uniref:Putative epimerase/dehydratase n=1 Tax=Paenarthrobacter aurescens TaxID=43663 RepID=A0A4Y3NAJ7_PAEAU|nr:NAD(P)H-binding protein [Paenarthrobacter aurescens]MDO6141679.1 NAD(P)H-binding protein [Paenarthrobacter aurescens]MDO6149442.1 NAD(P)H-binding protein [Paenarthrobacter aurescens]MDO6156728.1 NAD(P)H-binding protein [Paenarthrobacter aurescens]MDO6160714.1 NAD(P)H-binding protein [Paenarthrobacter aurescens]GEB18672.1 putative epimerase/dehydratase [Paenarthrobacter aurescens]
MKIAVYGATGMVGSQIVNESLTRGHEVTAISRKGAEVPGAAAQAADQADAEIFASIAKEHDVVVLATGPSRTGGDHSEWLDAMATAYSNAEGTRLMIVGGAGTLEVDGVRLLDSPDFPEAYKAEATTAAKALETVRKSPESLDWTVLAPAPVIQPGERTGEYAVAKDSPAGGSISTQDYAVAMLDEIERPAHRRARFTAAN